MFPWPDNKNYYDFLKPLLRNNSFYTNYNYIVFC
jgi:hypothetical protein